ncbi:MAG: hypothetical protein DRP56_07085 [Planctomycetota bacterium]|nr:MAG: hypothetical protein DRP56_07085 [Planctomycetota bacterium]
MRQKYFRTLTILCLSFVISGGAIADTWYVDPVNGDEAWDGRSPFHVPNTSEGPTQNIGGVIGQTQDYDIVVLFDGVYEGYSNVDSYIFDQIDNRHLQVTSAYGADNCVLNLSDPLQFGMMSHPEDSIPTRFYNITFTSEQDWNETAFTISHSDVQFIGCIFDDFTSINNYTRLFNLESESLPGFWECSFSSNTYAGLMICNGQNIQLTLDDCTFEGNICPDQDLSLIDLAIGTTAAFNNCIFQQNRATQHSFSIIRLNQDSDADIRGCVIRDNYAQSGACNGVAIYGRASLNLSNTTIENLWAEENPDGSNAVFLQDYNDVSIRNCTLNNNDRGVYAKDVDINQPNQLEIIDTEIIGNTHSDPVPYPEPGGITFGPDVGNVVIDNCVIQDNYSGIVGEGSCGDIIVSHCLVTGNERKGILLNYSNPDSTVEVRNCTLADNHEMGADLSGDWMLLKNSIIWGNFHRGIGGNPVVSYCNVEEGWGGPGAGNINVDPLFAAQGYWNRPLNIMVSGDDYHLKSEAGRYEVNSGAWILDDESSPCIDMGDPNDAVLDEPYGSGGRINMGCYGETEQASKTDICVGGIDGQGRMLSDFNHDCDVNLIDFAMFAAEWLDSTKQAN